MNLALVIYCLLACHAARPKQKTQSMSGHYCLLCFEIGHGQIKSGRQCLFVVLSLHTSRASKVTSSSSTTPLTYSHYAAMTCWTPQKYQNCRLQTGLKAHIYIYTYIYMPITSFDGPFLRFKKSRSRGKDEKLRQEKANMRKKTKHWHVKNPHTKCGGFSGSFFLIKLGKFWNLTFFWPTDWGYLYIYIDIL